MAYFGVWIYLKNQTQGTMTKTADPISSGKWVTNMPTTLAANSSFTGQATSRSGAVASCSGSVTYQLPDGTTLATITFDIPPVAANGGGMTLSGVGANNYVGGEYTSSSCTTPTTFPSSGDNVRVYFKVALATGAGG